MSGDGSSPPPGRSRDRDAFAAALARARRAHDDADRGRAREAAGIRRAGLDRESAALLGRREASPPADEAPHPAPVETVSGAAPDAVEGAGRRAADAALRAAGVAAEPAPDYAPEVRSPELRAILRAVPVAVEAGRVGDGAPALELAFGRALSVEIRAAARGGVDLVLRPDAALARSASAELPALLRALRARGVDVGRAEVRARAGPRGGRAR